MQEDKNLPVLLLLFNRPDETRTLISKLRLIQPENIYISCDGPRSSIPDEKQKVELVRSIVRDINWQCNLKTLFQDENLGCGKAVKKGIDWFFSHEGEGVILEDDCIPHPSFFKFSELLINKYRSNKKIWMISGFNPIELPYELDYFYSQNPAIWGWATWKDRWEKYDSNMGLWPDDNFLCSNDLNLPRHVQTYYSRAFTAIKNKSIDTWDYQWTYTILKNNGMVIKPKQNLISNIGVTGTHASKRNGINDPNLFLDTFDAIGEKKGIVGPNELVPFVLSDKIFYLTRIKSKTLLSRVKGFIKCCWSNRFWCRSARRNSSAADN